MNDRLQRALQALREQGHTVRTQVVDGRVQVTVDGCWLTAEQITELGAEFRAPRIEFDSNILTTRAIMCGKIAKDSSRDSAIADEAHALLRDWVMLQAWGTPAPPSYIEKIKLDNETQLLAARMETFLVPHLHLHYL